VSARDRDDDENAKIISTDHQQQQQLTRAELRPRRTPSPTTTIATLHRSHHSLSRTTELQPRERQRTITSSPIDTTTTNTTTSHLPKLESFLYFSCYNSLYSSTLLLHFMYVCSCRLESAPPGARRESTGTATRFVGSHVWEALRLLSLCSPLSYSRSRSVPNSLFLVSTTHP